MWTVYFIGLHNKPNMMALDSRTKTGKIIDMIISKVELPYKKLNLFPVDFMPKDITEINRYVDDFYRESDGNGFYVLLGKQVQKYLQDGLPNSISVNHPGYYIRKGNDAINNFIVDVSIFLNEVTVERSEIEP